MFRLSLLRSLIPIIPSKKSWKLNKTNSRVPVEGKNSLNNGICALKLDSRLPAQVTIGVSDLKIACGKYFSAMYGLSKEG